MKTKKNKKIIDQDQEIHLGAEHGVFYPKDKTKHKKSNIRRAINKIFNKK